MNQSLRLPIRLILLAVVTVIIQEAAVSQITIFGVSADLTPLVVMSVGLLAGSIPGAIMGFGVGLLVDIVLVQTLGVTSLLFIVIGYWSGRLRELRDPSHGLVPLAMGAAATAFAGLGMAVIQFLLGVDCAGQLAAAPADLHRGARQHAARAARVRGRAAGSSSPRCPRIRAGAAAARTPPAASARCSSRPSDSADPRRRDDPAAGRTGVLR